MSKEKEAIQNTNEGEVGYLKYVKVFYPESEAATMKKFKQWCFDHAGKKYITGIKMLMEMADYFALVNSLNYRIAALEEQIAAMTAPEDVDEEEEEEGIPTMGGKVK